MLKLFPQQLQGMWSFVGFVHVENIHEGFTCAHSREEEQPEEAEDGRGHHLGDGSGVDLLVQFGRQVSVVHVISIHKVFQQHVHQTCR